MTGRELQAAIVDLARTLGWRVAHFASVPVKRGPRVIWMTPAQADGRGFPDLILLRERLLAVEVKGDGDSLRDEQRTWLDAFAIAGEQAVVWTPKDWGEGGPIEKELSLRHRRFPQEASVARETPLPPRPRVELPPAKEIRG